MFYLMMHSTHFIYGSMVSDTLVEIYTFCIRLINLKPYESNIFIHSTYEIYVL